MSKNEYTILPEGIQPAQAVQAILTMMQAYHERELEKLNSILSGYDEILTGKLEITWQKVSSVSSNQRQALATFTQIVAAELDGGDCPIF